MAGIWDLGRDARCGVGEPSHGPDHADEEAAEDEPLDGEPAGQVGGCCGERFADDLDTRAENIV
jgi:hypothetical protein